MNASRYRTPSGCRALRSIPRAQSRKGCRPRRSTSYISGVWPASPPPHSTLHGRAYHVFAFHLKRAGESRTQCDWRHFGRLAGFTNQKKERRLDNGLQPFVKLRCSEGRVYSRAAEFLREVEELKGEPLLRPEPRELARPWHTDVPVRPITSFHANSRYGRDLHRADLAWALHAASHGLSGEQIEHEILNGRDLSKKGSAARRWAYRTASKAITPSAQ
jgi:RepB DNA-primase from phage plasmid